MNKSVRMQSVSVAAAIVLALAVIANPRLSVANGGDPDLLRQWNSTDQPSVAPPKPSSNDEIDLSKIPTNTQDACKRFTRLYLGASTKYHTSEALEKLRRCLERYYLK